MDLNAIFAQLAETFSLEALITAVRGFLPGLVAAVALLIFFYLVWRALRTALAFALAKADVDKTVRSFIVTVTQYGLITIAIITAMGQLGIDTASLMASLGVAGLTIGFAAKDALSNVVSGLFIFWDRPFTVDDLVEIGGTYGRVDTITLRSTRVVTPDGRMLAIPNTTVVNNTVVSYTNFPNLRLDVEVTVAVTEDIAEVRRVILELVGEYPEYNALDKEPVVEVKALNDYNVLLEVRVWIENEREHVQRRFELRERLFGRLTARGVEMPYETLALAPITVESARLRES